MTPFDQWIAPLAQHTPAEHCGAKAYRLGQMARLGYTIPAGQVLLEPLRQLHHARSGLTTAIAELERLIPSAATDVLVSRSAAVRAAIMDTELDPELREVLSKLWHKLWRGKTLVVRSSAHGEDSAHHSFAGQLDSFLGIGSLDELEMAIRRTWASLWSQRCVLYQHHHRVLLPRMGVIVQEQVDAQFSGVLFTKWTTNMTNSPTLTLEYCPGLADALVSGELTPGQILFDRSSANIVQHTPAPEANSRLDILAQPETLKELAQKALMLERELGAPLDIEWSIGRDGKIYFLQARPITASLPQDAHSVVWSNANIAENFPEPITPFLYSIVSKGYAAYFRNLGLGFGISRKRIAAMQDALEHIVGVHGGRLYYNLSNIHSLLYLAPMGKWLTRFFNDFVGAHEFPPPRQQAVTLSALERTMELLRIPFMVAWQYLRVKPRIGEFEQRIDDFCASTRRENLPETSLASLRDHVKKFLAIRVHHWNSAALADTAAMICYGVFKLLLARMNRDKNLINLHNDLLKGLTDIASGKPVMKLWELSRRIKDSPTLYQLFTEHEPDAIWLRLQQAEFSHFREIFLDYLEYWGFRNSSELMLTVPSPQENPRNTLALLKVYIARSESSPSELLHEQKTAREKLTERVLAEITPQKWLRKIPLLSRAWWLRRWLHATHGAIRLRERARFRQARLYVHLRHVLLAIGERLHQDKLVNLPEDIFFLTYEELDDLLSGHAMFPHDVSKLITQRRRAHDELIKLMPPDDFTLSFGSYLPMETKSTAEKSAPMADRLRGAGACGGRITAAATVLESAADGHVLRKGDILITRQTDPGWASVFFLVSGLVVERGGMLSHGAIIAREYGIPAVVGVAGATQVIKTGNRLSIDGDQGVVDILR